MADSATLDEIRNQLKEEWRSAVDTTEEEVKSLIPEGEMSEEESQNISNQAKDTEAENKANAIVDTAINSLLEKIEALEGRLQELESATSGGE